MSSRGKRPFSISELVHIRFLMLLVIRYLLLFSSVTLTGTNTL